ncbi:MAG: magnesium transporter [Planctomycetes bacterium]|nr:magnesium transporter [Planctomycetota bacterium]
MDHPDIARIIEGVEGALGVPRKIAGEVRAADIAQALGELDESHRLLVFSLLGDPKAADVLAAADERVQESLLEALPAERLTALLSQMDPDDAADVLQSAPEEDRPRIVAGLDEETRREVSLLDAYDPESAGGIMTTDVPTCRDGDTLGRVIEQLGDVEQPEALTAIYVVDAAGTLLGLVDLRALLVSDRDALVRDVMDTDVISAHVDDDQEEVARLVDRYDLASVPVVDAARRLKGVITVDDVIDVLGEEASEDMLRLAGTGAVHPTGQPLVERLLARAPWLSVTLVGSFSAGLVLEFIEQRWFPHALEVQSSFKALLYFIPLIGGMAGNVGSQSSTIMVRGFATGEVDPKRPMRVLKGELLLGLVIGVLAGLIVGVAAALVHPERPWLGLVVGTALPAAIGVAALAGTLVPFACAAVGIDPAYASGPFLQTLNDLSAYVIYFTVAIGLMDGLQLH